MSFKSSIKWWGSLFVTEKFIRVLYNIVKLGFFGSFVVWIIEKISCEVHRYLFERILKELLLSFELFYLVFKVTLSGLSHLCTFEAEI